MSEIHTWKLIEGYEDWKIYPMYRIFYFECLKTAASSAITSWQDINDIVTNQEAYDEHKLILIDLAENIVNQAGIISRYFFPSKDNRNSDKNRIHQLRGERLREIFSVDPDNLLANRKFRNHIEHFDENLDKFLNQPVAGTIYPKTVFQNSGQVSSIMHLFKAYVVSDFKYISLREEIALPPLIEEIYRIYNLIIDQDE